MSVRRFWFVKRLWNRHVRRVSKARDAFRYLRQCVEWVITMPRASVKGRVSEKVVQSHIVQLLIGVGGSVYVSGTRRTSLIQCPVCNHTWMDHSAKQHSTRQTPGIPDLLVFLPDRRRAGARRLLFVEAKAEGGSMTKEQKFFKFLCGEGAIDHVVGDLNAVIAWLMREGYLRADQVPHYRLPAPPGTSSTACEAQK